MDLLKDAFERLYRVFATMPKPLQIEGCRHCVDDQEVEVLIHKDLRALTPGDLASYASSAFLTVGSVEDYLYFLPRILEISATDPGWQPSPEVTGRAIQSANPGAWTSEQRAALEHVLDAVVARTIQTRDYDFLDAWICAVARMGFDVRPYLMKIAADPAAVLGYFEVNAQSLQRNELSNAFWEPPSPGHDAVVEWFHSLRKTDSGWRQGLP